jgi:hypothetical protein
VRESLPTLASAPGFRNRQWQKQGYRKFQEQLFLILGENGFVVAIMRL